MSARLEVLVDVLSPRTGGAYFMLTPDFNHSPALAEETERSLGENAWTAPRSCLREDRVASHGCRLCRSRHRELRLGFGEVSV